MIEQKKKKRYILCYLQQTYISLFPLSHRRIHVELMMSGKNQKP